ncbi:hypothetical protein CAEBREN_32375 [Caenorhabditis brenneri]|uniref:Uncharacterized protein n=1 Tax=Caenorhabditis brenneri TaxID=135651 RepID=G0NZ18_CAEBE|nr:hypothetical protein CAEBREN_32375 [Caenorhabditis brenneri]
MASEMTIEEIRQYLITKHTRFSTEKIEACLQSFLRRRNDKKRASSLVASGVEKKERGTSVSSTGKIIVKESKVGKEHQIWNAERERRRKEAEEKEHQQKRENEREELKRKKQKESFDRDEAERTRQEMKAEEDRTRRVAEAQAEKKRKEKEASEKIRMERIMQETKAEDERLSRFDKVVAEKIGKEKESSDQTKAERKKRRMEAVEERRKRDAEGERMQRIRESMESVVNREKEEKGRTMKDSAEKIPQSQAGHEKRKNQDGAVSEKDRLIMVTQERRREEHRSVDERFRMRIEAEVEKANQEEEDSANQGRKRRVSELRKTGNATISKPSTSRTTFLPERDNSNPGETVMEDVGMMNSNLLTLGKRSRMSNLSAADSERSPSVCVLADSGKTPSSRALESSSAPIPKQIELPNRKEVQKRELESMLAAFREWENHEPQFTKAGKETAKSGDTKPISFSETRQRDSLSRRSMISSNDLTGNECIQEKETSQEPMNDRMEDDEELHNYSPCPQKKRKSMKLSNLNCEYVTVTPEASALLLSKPIADPLESRTAASKETDTQLKSNLEMKKYTLKKIKTEEPNTDEVECENSSGDEWLKKIFPNEQCIKHLRKWFFRENRSADKAALNQGSKTEKTEKIEPCKKELPFFNEPQMSVNDYNLTFFFKDGYVQFEFVTEEQQLELEEPDKEVIRTDVDEDDGEEIHIIGTTTNKKPFICRCPHNQEVLSKEEIVESVVNNARRIIQKHYEFLKTHVECISKEALSKYKTRPCNIPWVENKRYTHYDNLNPSDAFREHQLAVKREKIPIDPKFHRPGPIVGGIPRCYQLRDVPKICATCKGRIRVYYKPTGFKPISLDITYERLPSRKPTKKDLRLQRLFNKIRLINRKRQKEIRRKMRLKMKKTKAELFFTREEYYNEKYDSHLTFLQYHRKCLRDYPHLVPRSVKEFFKAFPKKFVLEMFHPRTGEEDEEYLSELLEAMDAIDEPKNYTSKDKAWDSVSELSTDSESEIEEEDIQTLSQCSEKHPDERKDGRKSLKNGPKLLTASKEVHYASVSASFKIAPVAQKVNKQNEKGDNLLDLKIIIDNFAEKTSDESNKDLVERVAESDENQPSKLVFAEDELLNDPLDDDYIMMNNGENNATLDEPVDNANEEPTPSAIDNSDEIGNIGTKFEYELLRSVSPSNPLSTSNPFCDDLDISIDMEQAGNVDAGVDLESLSPQIGNLISSSDSVQVEREQLQYTEEDLLGEYGQLKEVEELPDDNNKEPVEPVAKKSKLEENSASEIKKAVQKRKGRLNKIRNDDIEVEDTLEAVNESTGKAVEDKESSRKPVVLSETQTDVRMKRGTTTSTISEKSRIQTALERTVEPIGDVVEKASTSNSAASSKVQKAKNTKKRRTAKNAKLEVRSSSQVCVSVNEESAEDGEKSTKLGAENASEIVKENPLGIEEEERSEKVDEPVEDVIGEASEEVEEEYEKPVTRKRGRNKDAPFLPTNATRTKRHFLSKNNPAPRTRKASDPPIRLTGVLNKDDAALLGDGRSEDFKKLPLAVQKLLDFDSPEKRSSGTGESGLPENVEVKKEPLDDEKWVIPDPIGDNTRQSRKRIRQEKERSILAKIKQELAPDEECQVLMMNVSQVKEEVDDPDLQVLSIGFNKEAVDPEEEAPPLKQIDPQWEEKADHRCMMIKGLWNAANEIFSSDPAKFSKLMMIIANDNQMVGRVFKYSATVEDRYSKFDPEFIKLLAASSITLTNEQTLCLDYNSFSNIYRRTASQSVINHNVTPVNLHNVIGDIKEIKKRFLENARPFMDSDVNTDAVNATETILLGQFIACSLKMAGLSLVTWATSTHIHRRLEMIYHGWKMFLFNGGFLRILLALDRPDVTPLSDSFRAYCTEYLEDIETNWKKAIEIVEMSDDAIMEHFQIEAELSKEEMKKINEDIQNETNENNTIQCNECSINDFNAWFSTIDLKLLHFRLHDINTHTCHRCYDDMNDFKYVIHRITSHFSLKTTLP